MIGFDIQYDVNIFHAFHTSYEQSILRRRYPKRYKHEEEARRNELK